jgi:plastocyanin
VHRPITMRLLSVPVRSLAVRRFTAITTLAATVALVTTIQMPESQSNVSISKAASGIKIHVRDAGTSSIAAPHDGLLALLGSAVNRPFALDFLSPAAPEPPSRVASNGIVQGSITYDGVLPKAKIIDMSREPNCAKQYKTPPVVENVVGGDNKGLANVVVYISAGMPDEAPTGHVSLSQWGCRYFPHVLALQAKQEIWVKNEDDVNHTVHLMTVVNPELNKLQAVHGPEFTITNEKPEFIRVKCELHPWMRGVIAVLKNSHFAVTEADGSFKLPDLPAGKYTVTVWHESFGTQSQQVVIGSGENKNLNFVFKVKPV